MVPGRVLFSLLGLELPGIGLAGDREDVPVKHRASCGVRCTAVGP